MYEIRGIENNDAKPFVVVPDVMAGDMYRVQLDRVKNIMAKRVMEGKCRSAIIDVYKDGEWFATMGFNGESNEAKKWAERNGQVSVANG